MREEVCSLLFRLSYSHTHLPQQHRLRIKQVSGQVAPALVDRAHKCVQKIVELLGECEVQEFMESLETPDKTREMFGAHIKVGGPCIECPIPDNPRLLNLLVEEKPAKPQITLQYDKPAPAPKTNKKKASSAEVYDHGWVEAEMLAYYVDTSMIPELAKGTVALLMSSKTDEELQNELFDFLGFDRFELIQKLLEKRSLITTTPVDKQLKLAIIKDELGNRGASLGGGPVLGQTITVMSETEKQYLKQARKEEKKMIRAVKQLADDDDVLDFNPDSLKAKREMALIEASEALLFKRNKEGAAPEVRFPYVFDNYDKARQTLGFISGTKLVLPEGFERKDDNVKEEVVIPKNDPAPPDVGSNLIPISTLDEVGQVAFRNCKTLNRIQTVVYPAAYHSNHNLLICAPTGAGKTNIAMLTVVHQIRQHMDEAGVIQKDKFKVIYVAPMKALAAEMARNFGKRLEPLGLSVRELTGDMHLTKAEMMATTMLITTPEKWDVTTRKPGDTQLAHMVKLLIIDEVHLLHGDRGPVLETLVARTLRMVESQQSMIRIVGLSATLPNYIDIASFLHVNPYKGLFFFDGRFRPVPLGLTFCGIKAMGRIRQMEEMDRVAYDKAYSFVQKGDQVMVFVHARNGTLRTAENLIRLAQEAGKTEAFVPESRPEVTRARNDLARSRNKKLMELFDNGFGVHHAGLLRSDRSMIERLFGDGLIKVLVCTATLAWGVNLPAHAVIIKGTDIYDSKRGEMVDLGILDVLQIFGRAGRPQFDSSGQGIILTSQEKLVHYLSLLTNQYPIESSFVNHLADNLNAEITLGTVTNIEEAKAWLKYTYLYVRMRKNPQCYGLLYKDAQNDPMLERFREGLIVKAAEALDKAHMVRYDHTTGYLHSTDLGRIASQYYIKYDTVEVFNEFLRQVMNEADILAIISQSSEFKQLKVRDEEMTELDELHRDCAVPSFGGVENVHGKVNVLLQSYISRTRVEGFSLVSDMNYVTDNSVRITRALFEIVLHKNWPLLAGRLLTMAKMLERQMWGFQSPMRQFSKLPPLIMDKIDEKRLTVEKIRDMDAKDIGIMLRHERMGKEVRAAAWQFPLLSLDATIQPITRTVLRVTLNIFADFRWSDKIHGKQESYYIWVEDPNTNHMYHHEQFSLTKKQVLLDAEQQLIFTIPLLEPLPSQYIVRAISDRWLGCESSTVISFQHLILPERHPPHTALLDLDPLPVTALNNAQLEVLYPFSHFNPIQTQLFHTLYHSDHNVLLGAPTGSGKTIAAEIAMFRVFRDQPDCKVVYIAPMKALVRERVLDWKVRIEKHLRKPVVELTGDVSPDIRSIQAASVIITTPEKWDGISRSWQTRSYVQKVALIVIDEIHLLGEGRGPVLEVIVSRTNFISSHTNRKLRIIGLSTALANARDLGDWLGIKQVGLFNFRPSVRPVPLEVHIAGFPGKHYCPRMATMNKPTFKAIRQHSPDKPVLVFVSSRRQTRLTAIDLMGFVVTEENPKQWLHMPEHELDQLVSTVKDENLRLCLSFGVGLHHAGLVEKDRKLVEELFVNRKIQILVTTATLAWGVNFPAHLVVVKGTEFFDGKLGRYVDFPVTDVLQMMGRAGRPQFDDQGVAVILVHDQKKHFYKKFLYEPFPVESHLLDVLADHLNAEIVAGTISTRQEGLDYLTWTYFFRRLVQNPSYYGLQVTDESDAMSGGTNIINSFLSNIVDKALSELEASYCIEFEEDDRTIVSTTLGKIGSFYYLSHKTIQLLHDKMSKDISLENLFILLTLAQEYAELPVRHNEDLLNEQLSKQCPLPVNPHTFDSPHTKAFLLLQAHLLRLPLPCVDYLTDTKSVLDQSLRILQAMMDVSASAGWLATTLHIQVLMQMLTQARWHTDCSLLTLPYTTSDILSSYRHPRSRAAIQSLPELEHCLSSGGFRGAGGASVLANMLGEDLTTTQVDTLYEVINNLPKFELMLVLLGGGEEKEVDHRNPNSSRAGPAKWLEVHADADYSIAVNIKRLNKYQSSRNSSSPRTHAPKFPKPRDEGWFLVLGETDGRELLALKRLPPIKGYTKQVVNFRTPPDIGNRVLTLYFMSDGYLGLDQQCTIPIKVVPGTVPNRDSEVSYSNCTTHKSKDDTVLLGQHKSDLNEAAAVAAAPFDEFPPLCKTSSLEEDSSSTNVTSSSGGAVSNVSGSSSAAATDHEWSKSPDSTPSNSTRSSAEPFPKLQHSSNSNCATSSAEDSGTSSGGVGAGNRRGGGNRYHRNRGGRGRASMNPQQQHCRSTTDGSESCGSGSNSGVGSTNIGRPRNSRRGRGNGSGGGSRGGW